MTPAQTAHCSSRSSEQQLSQNHHEPGAAITNSTSATVYPPVPPYSPSAAHPDNTLQSSGQTYDPEFLHYTSTYGRGGAAVAPRAPEAFPSDRLSFRSNNVHEPLPEYGADEPPRYISPFENKDMEPKTLAMYFFKSGFFFPVFWVFGALMLITPLRSPNPLSPGAQRSFWPPPDPTFIAWCNENVRTEEDKMAFLKKMHEVEMKWAKRCLMALGMLLCFCVAIGVTIFAVTRAAD